MTDSETESTKTILERMKHAARGDWDPHMQHIPDALNDGAETIEGLLVDLEAAAHALGDYAGTVEAPTIKRLNAKIAAVRGTKDSEPSRASAFAEQNCPGHVASDHDPKVCGRCGVHIDSLRPE